MMELIYEERLHRFMYDCHEEHRLSASISTLSGVAGNDNDDNDDDDDDNDEVVLLVLNSLYGLYSSMYSEFVDMWIANEPKNIMDFPRIFDIFKKDIRSRHDALRY